MARKPTVNLEALIALGVDRLAALVLEATERDSAFKKIVVAALAGTKGPDAVAALIDRRLASLEKARSFVEWDKAKTFAADLASLTSSIVTELTGAAPRLAFDRLVRFVATHPKVFDRIDDSYGRVQGIYDDAVDEAVKLVSLIPPQERPALLAIPIASDLENAHPLAATILYRALIDEILDRGRSPAYGHGARYLAVLDQIAGRIERAWVDIEEHVAWREALRRKHGRKSSFWLHVDDRRR